MRKFVRRVLCFCLILVSLGCLVILSDAILEPVGAEKEARKFLEVTPFTLEQFGKVDVQRRGDFNYYSWSIHNGEELLELEVVYGRACLYFIGTPDRRDICRETKRNVSHFIECVRVRVDGELFINCGCIAPGNFVEAKHTPA